MFTGLIEEMGVVQKLKKMGEYRLLEVMSPQISSQLSEGESVAVNGVCLTVVSSTEKSFQVEVSPLSLAQTNLGLLKPADPVNLERAMQLNDRLGGHIVLGHVDGVGIVEERKSMRDSLLVSIKPPAHLSKYLIPRGSIAVDGVSLTIVSAQASSFVVSLIPYTAKHTTLGLKSVGEKVNLEADILAKYVERLLNKPARLGLSYEEFVRKLGGA